MSVCKLSEAQSNTEKGALTRIEQAVQDNSQGALQNILNEVNDSRLSDPKFCANNKSLESKLSPEAKSATNLNTVSEDWNDVYPEAHFLEVNDIWAQQAGK